MNPAARVLGCVFATCAVAAAPSCSSEGTDLSAISTRLDASPAHVADGSTFDAAFEAATTDGAHDASGTFDADGSSACAAPLAQCGDAGCVDIRLDTGHCGACDRACATDEVCSSGTCALTCVGGTKKCGARCVDPKVDSNNCGDCAIACSQGYACVNGRCEVSCGPGATECPADSGTVCAELDRDALNCGACGNACTSGYACVNSVCTISCLPGWGPCSEGGILVCKDFQIDPRHCGACSEDCGSFSCSAARCNRRRVFAITGFAGDVGLDGADQECQGWATAVGLRGAYRAWISDATSSPSTRFIRSSVPYVLYDGTIIAADWTELTSGTLRAAIRFDVHNAGLTGQYVNVWTNTAVDGTSAHDNDCDDWSTPSSSRLGTLGDATQTDSNWTWAPAAPLPYCTYGHSLYCFEQ